MGSVGFELTLDFGDSLLAVFEASQVKVKLRFPFLEMAFEEGIKVTRRGAVEERNPGAEPGAAIVRRGRGDRLFKEIGGETGMEFLKRGRRGLKGLPLIGLFDLGAQDKRVALYSRRMAGEVNIVAIGAVSGEDKCIGEARVGRGDRSTGGVHALVELGEESALAAPVRAGEADVRQNRSRPGVGQVDPAMGELPVAEKKKAFEMMKFGH